MDKDSYRHTSFTRRAILLSGGAGALFAGIGARLFSLQVVQGEQYQVLAEENRVDIRLLSPLRGKVLDRFGVEVAVNKQNFRLILIPEQAKSVEETLDKLGEVIEITEGRRERILREVARNRSFVPVTVAEDLDWETFAFLNVHALEFPGIQPDVGHTRSYPYGGHLAHVVGYVSAVSEDDKAKALARAKGDVPLLAIPDYRIGKDGIEQVYEDRLRGKAGRATVEVNAGGRTVRELSRDEGLAGEDLVLTLDLGLQLFAADRISGESGSVVVIDIHTGEILALVSEPGFDPNPFYFGVSGPTYSEWLNDQYKPLFNKATKGQYPPGSTVKMLIALAGLEAGLIRPNDVVYCTGSPLRLGTDSFHCWKRGGHGTVDLRKSIKQSCDIYYYELALKLGIDKIAEMARDFGLGSDYGFDLPFTKPGMVPDRDWKMLRHKRRWQQYDTLHVGIGQGYMLATPLQLAVMCARIANGGKAVKPRIARAAGSEFLPAEEPDKILVSERNLERVMDAMTAVVNEPGGTARGSILQGEGLSMAGKTGTAQVRRISKAERLAGIVKNEDLPWERRDHALFVAFGPVEEPRYAVAVVIDHGGSGSKAAAPVARDVLREAIGRDPSRQPPYVPLGRTRVSAPTPKRRG